jgi:prolyl-tRNA synthetase
VTSWPEFTEAVATGWARALHCGQPRCEEAIKAETGATPRCIPSEAPDESGTCVRCNAPSAYGKRVLFGRAY